MAMWYAIMASDIAGSEQLRASARAQHLHYVSQLRDQGRLLLAGPHPGLDSPDPGPAGMSGSLIVAEFQSLSAAQSWADEDPYVQAGVFENVVIKPFIAVYS